MFARATGAVVGGAAGGSVKDSVVKVVIGRYAELFTAAVALWSKNEEAAVLDSAANEDAEEAARRAKPVDGDDEMAFARCVRSHPRDGSASALSSSLLRNGKLTRAPHNARRTACSGSDKRSTSCWRSRRRSRPTRPNAGPLWSRIAKSSCKI